MELPVRNEERIPPGGSTMIYELSYLFSSTLNRRVLRYGSTSSSYRRLNLFLTGRSVGRSLGRSKKQKDFVSSALQYLCMYAAVFDVFTDSNRHIDYYDVRSERRFGYSQ